MQFSEPLEKRLLFLVLRLAWGQTVWKARELFLVKDFALLLKYYYFFKEGLTPLTGMLSYWNHIDSHWRSKKWRKKLMEILLFLWKKSLRCSHLGGGWALLVLDWAYAEEGLPGSNWACAGEGHPGQEHACAYPLFWQLIMDTGPALIHHSGLAPPVNFRSCLSSFCLPGILGGQKVWIIAEV